MVHTYITFIQQTVVHKQKKKLEINFNARVYPNDPTVRDKRKGTRMNIRTILEQIDISLYFFGTPNDVTLCRLRLLFSDAKRNQWRSQTPDLHGGAAYPLLIYSRDEDMSTMCCWASFGFGSLCSKLQTRCAVPSETHSHYCADSLPPRFCSMKNWLDDRYCAIAEW